MFSKILIANRGEIAVRVIRACRELGIKTVAVYSEADATCLHTHLADERICVGPPISTQSYLNMENILKAAQETTAEAIHPGYGYLAESEVFAEACERQGLIFIGPKPENLQLAGDKITSKKIIQDARVPIIPSSPAGVRTEEEASALCEQMGYPVMIKASGGGGGRGIRICENEEALFEEFTVAKTEARSAFGNDEIYLEKFIISPRHIEFQVLADRFGNVAHLGERECTIQRRYQKLIEESPSPRLTPELRSRMAHAAITVAKAVKYFNAGTVEFLVDKDDHFYFMEINARIQVEHPVTEVVTGLDLIKEQIRLSSGEGLGYASEDLRQRGWAIECRINAEDPDRNFQPSPGVIEEYFPPSGFGVRLDTHLYQGYELPIFYDSLVAKVISYDLTREGAIRIMKRALEEFRIKPLKTTIPLYLKVLDDPSFQRGDFDTGFIERFLPEEDEED
ncbi:MAG: acetyl-CoA carboxylase biotin carboxylase subunit [Desulfobacteraceae bacterium]|jgi:acetyl-CoA carboxylase biotin carboxylase subunit